MAAIKRLTILHSNDLHGDFLAEEVDSQLIGGVSMLSGYVNTVRKEEKNAIYCIAGDMFRGSVIDSEFRSISTIEILNMLAPDVVTIGNHEIDYGIAHLLFLEKCAKFPIINANMHTYGPWNSHKNESDLYQNGRQDKTVCRFCCFPVKTTVNFTQRKIATCCNFLINML